MILTRISRSLFIPARSLFPRFLHWSKLSKIWKIKYFDMKIDFEFSLFDFSRLFCMLVRTTRRKFQSMLWQTVSQTCLYLYQNMARPQKLLKIFSNQFLLKILKIPKSEVQPGVREIRERRQREQVRKVFLDEMLSKGHPAEHSNNLMLPKNWIFLTWPSGYACNIYLKFKKKKY